jgi:hypothetical protein
MNHLGGMHYPKKIRIKKISAEPAGARDTAIALPVTSSLAQKRSLIDQEYSKLINHYE